MNVSEIHIYSKNLPIIGGPYTMAGTELFSVQTTIVKMVSDNGLIGWGETCPLGPTYQAEHCLGVQAALRQLAPSLIGESALTPLVFRRAMDRLLNGHNSAKAALDIAVLDVLAKHHGVRVCDLLGGAATEFVPSYYALGLGEPEDVARQALEKVGEGFRRLQLKAGGRDIEKDIAVVRKVWEAIGSKARLVVDANRSLTTRDTLQLSLQCAQIPIVIEQPCNTMDEVAIIRTMMCHPIFLDENTENVNEVMNAISRGVCDGFGLKVTRLGGLTRFAIVRDMCEVRSMPITCDDTFGGDIIAAACVHAGATVVPNLFDGVWTASSYISEPYDSENGIKVHNGTIKVPTGPGLGVNPADDKIGELIASFG